MAELGHEVLWVKTDPHRIVLGRRDGGHAEILTLAVYTDIRELQTPLINAIAEVWSPRRLAPDVGSVAGSSGFGCAAVAANSEHTEYGR